MNEFSIECCIYSPIVDSLKPCLNNFSFMFFHVFVSPSKTLFSLNKLYTMSSRFFTMQMNMLFSTLQNKYFIYFVTEIESSKHHKLNLLTTSVSSCKYITKLPYSITFSKYSFLLNQYLFESSKNVC